MAAGPLRAQPGPARARASAAGEDPGLQRPGEGPADIRQPVRLRERAGGKCRGERRQGNQRQVRHRAHPHQLPADGGGLPGRRPGPAPVLRPALLRRSDHRPPAGRLQAPAAGHRRRLPGRLRRPAAGGRCRAPRTAGSRQPHRARLPAGAGLRAPVRSPGGTAAGARGRHLPRPGLDLPPAGRTGQPHRPRPDRRRRGHRPAGGPAGRAQPGAAGHDGRHLQGRRRLPAAGPATARATPAQPAGTGPRTGAAGQWRVP
ncbi:hypothetical protein D3C80_889300 [compost metagenome]